MIVLNNLFSLPLYQRTNAISGIYGTSGLLYLKDSKRKIEFKNYNVIYWFILITEHMALKIKY